MKTVYVVIETPGGNAQKYTFNKELNSFILKKVLPAGMVFPYDFGFIPHTKGGDGDPLDVLVLSEFKTFPGCMVECRIIGAVLARQQKGGKIVRNDRYIAVPVLSKTFEKVRNLRDISPGKIKELKEFFINYNKLEGKKFEPYKLLNAQETNKLLKHNSSSEK